MGMKTTGLRYLGGISGQGAILHDGKEITPASFDFDGYFRAAAGVTGSGEIRLPAGVLKDLFGRKDLQLLTDQGRLLDLSFSDLKQAPSGDVAHVDVTGTMAPGDWRQ
jgi:hypothetical protein